MEVRTWPTVAHCFHFAMEHQSNCSVVDKTQFTFSSSGTLHAGSTVERDVLTHQIKNGRSEEQHLLDDAGFADDTEEVVV